ncbi:formate dehydrogenase subunit gamma [Alteromonas mediterranea]|uniref:formate dehydrogenase subunit gamma n=1 Tax=Alteromonas mediterranea TaxID=314275 RepID=UPI0003557D63|nr:formate dehydrogenase subunit gamma [Alteromonas mediterranea]AGP88890.1 formate dehydrogenase subunit gamma [Alteromonas mediterranea U7]AGP92999.1 formate dehydrogenase subunit gamma [Alteromonas mediterranea U8]
MTRTNGQQSSLDKIATIIENKRTLPGALLPILHDIQHEFGYIPKNALPILAKQLQQTEAEIYGVISFYAHFHLSERGRHTVEICRGEACQAMGSRQLEQAIQGQLGVTYGQTTEDKNITLEPVYCLGNCACSPSIKVGDKTYGRMTAEKFMQLSQELSVYKVSLGEEL